MIKKISFFSIHLSIVILLTIVTQVGGVIYIISLFFKKVFKKHKALHTGLTFVLLYTLFTFLIIPRIAPIFGREKITNTDQIKAHHWFYTIANRNYVTPALQNVLKQTAKTYNMTYPGIRLTYLDANFPFLDGFPLLPHLSHSDGKKIDISFIYKDKSGDITNKKKSRSGYGIFEAPLDTDYNQNKACKAQGYWQYDFPKYLSFGTKKPNMDFSNEATRDILNIIISEPEVSKIFVEPHLIKRMQLKSPKFRFHGCQAVRHDDHIHIQIK